MRCRCVRALALVVWPAALLAQAGTPFSAKANISAVRCGQLVDVGAGTVTSSSRAEPLASGGTRTSLRPAGEHRSEAEVIRSGADFALPARAHHVPRAVLIGAQKRAASVHAFGDARLVRIERR